MTCQNSTTHCDDCGRRVCDRCARCYERVARAPGPHFTHQCPSRWCRWAKTAKRIVWGHA